MRPFIAGRKLNIFKGKEAGVGLIETVIALALLGITAVAFLSSMSTVFRAEMVSQERVVAESLANSQLEHVKVQGYIAAADYDSGDPSKSYQPITIPGDLVDKGYAIEINPPVTVTIPGVEGAELQSITVVIRRDGEEMLTISDYKAG